MKVGYEKPMLTIEEYELNTAIASGCSIRVSLGPGEYYDTDTGTYYTVCEEYDQGTYDSVVNFYDDSCSCYLSSGDSPLMTS
ncbi:MAG: hypothetical protein LUC30_02425 [Clostridiales bacterium]|nr:hypothetical protein [Clostridiales bacterium]